MLNKAGVQFTTLALLAALISHDARAAPADAKGRAAELFEQGVRQFASADYAAAAESFLAADDVAPSSRALLNGLTAARRAGLHLAVAKAAQRALSRPDIDTGAKALAHEALAESARSLSLVDVTCAPSPCTLTADGAAIAPGPEYVLPGTHDFVATGAGDASATEHVTCVAGASYRLTLTPKAPASAAAPPAPVAPLPRAPIATSAPPKASAPPHSTKPFPPAVFYAGVAATAVLAGLTTWSGIETLSAKSDFESGKADDWSHVHGLAFRTDVLLSSALVVGAATGAAGLWLVNWGGGSGASAAITPGGVAISAGGHF